VTHHNHPVIHVKTAYGCVVPDVAAEVVAATSVATALAVVQAKTVAPVAVAVTNVAMALAVLKARPVVTANVVIRSGLKRHILQSTSLVLVLLSVMSREWDATE